MWFWYALLSSIFSAISIITLKKVLHHVSAPLVTWSLFALSIPFLIVISIKSGIPKISTLFFVGAGGSSIFFAFSKTMSLSSFKKSFLSNIYPLTSFSALFTYIFGLIFLSERIGLTGIAGLVITVFGAYILNAEEMKEDVFKPFKLLFTNSTSFIYLIAMVLSSLSAILDKVALSSSSPASPAFTLLVENFLMSLLLTSYMTHKDRNWINELKNNFLPLLAASLVYMVLGLFVFLGFSSGPVALVSGIKRIEVIFVLLLSSIFFGDKLTKHTLIASVIMLTGVILMKL
ncbi:EamA family transporter [Candidatus Roizmanbacteria bacterium]|nr:EamA family transporter [Candidatus Roizmanbacteria bacterium]